MYFYLKNLLDLASIASAYLYVLRECNSMILIIGKQL